MGAPDRGQGAGGWNEIDPARAAPEKSKAAATTSPGCWIATIYSEICH